MPRLFHLSMRMPMASSLTSFDLPRALPFGPAHRKYSSRHRLEQLGGNRPPWTTPGRRRRSFGWPCYEGADGTAYGSTSLCGRLSRQSSATSPAYAYQHNQLLGTGDTCAVADGSSAVSLSTAEAHTRPRTRGDVLADAARSCIWVMFPDQDGRPDPSTVRTVLSGASARSICARGRQGISFTPVAIPARSGALPMSLEILRQWPRFKALSRLETLRCSSHSVARARSTRMVQH